MFAKNESSFTAGLLTYVEDETLLKQKNVFPSKPGQEIDEEVLVTKRMLPVRMFRIHRPSPF
jgi:hypothetical protein